MRHKNLVPCLMCGVGGLVVSALCAAEARAADDVIRKRISSWDERRKLIESLRLQVKSLRLQLPSLRARARSAEELKAVGELERVLGDFKVNDVEWGVLFVRLLQEDQFLRSQVTSPDDDFKRRMLLWDLHRAKIDELRQLVKSFRADHARYLKESAELEGKAKKSVKELDRLYGVQLKQTLQIYGDSREAAMVRRSRNDSRKQNKIALEQVREDRHTIIANRLKLIKNAEQSLDTLEKKSDKEWEVLFLESMPKLDKPIAKQAKPVDEPIEGF